MIAYACHIYFDNSPKRGGYNHQRWLWKKFIRSGLHMSAMRRYFPLRFARVGPPFSTKNKKKKYVFGYHPHGILAYGCVGHFLTDSGLEQLLPDLNLKVLTLDIVLANPFAN